MSSEILVVEHNPTVRASMRVALQASGYRVSEATDAKSALRAVLESSPQLVVLDCQLAGVDGFELGRQMRDLSPTLPVIAVTGWAQADDRRMLTSGFLDVLVKPVEPRSLAEVVGRYVLQSAPRPAPSAQKRVVLLADDDPMQRKLAALALTAAGFEVVVAADGEEALRIAPKLSLDAIVSDVLMPRMDGFALCRAIRALPAFANVAVVLMSAHYLEREDHDLAARFGANRYVSRTSGFDVVVRAVLESIDSPTAEPTQLGEDERQEDRLRRIAHQLERQATLGVGLARRTSLQASWLSLLDDLSDCVARQLDPESMLGETLAQCLDAAGLTTGAILLDGPGAVLVERAVVGPLVPIDWTRHAPLVRHAISRTGVLLPSSERRPDEVALLADLGATAGLIVGRDEVLGALVLAGTGNELASAEDGSALRAARSVSMQLGQAIALSRNITKLASAEQRYRALFENTRDAIAVMTTEGVILEANRGLENLLGTPRSAIIGRLFTDFAPDGKSGRRLSEYEMALAGAPAGDSSKPVTFHRADGGRVQVELSRTVIVVGGDRHIVSVGRDVTERVRLEEELRQAHKMEAVGRLAGGIAHDFNNVLSVILSYGEFLLEDLPEGDARRDDVLEIRKSADRAAELTRQLLRFSRQQVVEPKVVDLNEVVTGIDKMLQRILGADVELVSISTKSIGRVKVDRGSMEQVIMNLVVNARDAMPNGGKLTMETANVVFETATAATHGLLAGRHVMFSVTDTGLGMDAPTRARIFEPFFTTKGVGKGTGLGLSTVFGIVQQSRGAISVSSEMGRGTSFQIFLPCVDDALDALRAPPPSVTVQGTETILLVEDDDQVRAVASSILKKSGYHVLEAHSAAEAARLSEGRSEGIELLLTDIVMPQESGTELAMRLLARRPEMRVLCMSGYTDDVAVRGQVLRTDLAFVQKPFTPALLTSRVREVLDGDVPFRRVPWSDVAGSESGLSALAPTD